MGNYENCEDNCRNGKNDLIKRCKILQIKNQIEQLKKELAELEKADE